MCTSINECMCHGIPDSRPLRDGDIVNIDVTVYLNVRPDTRCWTSHVLHRLPRAFLAVCWRQQTHLGAFMGHLVW